MGIIGVALKADRKLLLKGCKSLINRSYFTTNRFPLMFLVLTTVQFKVTKERLICDIFCYCRHMYWVNGGRNSTIEIADLDGSNRRILFTNPNPPTGLTIDFSTGLLFWADQDERKIECAYLNGTNRRVVVSGLSKTFALTQFKDYIYYADWSTIYRANKTNGLDQTRIKRSIEVVMDILVFHRSRQEGLF